MILPTYNTRVFAESAAARDGIEMLRSKECGCVWKTRYTVQDSGAQYAVVRARPNCEEHGSSGELITGREWHLRAWQAGALDLLWFPVAAVLVVGWFLLQVAKGALIVAGAAAAVAVATTPIWALFAAGYPHAAFWTGMGYASLAFFAALSYIVGYLEWT